MVRANNTMYLIKTVEFKMGNMLVKGSDFPVLIVSLQCRQPLNAADYKLHNYRVWCL